MLPSRRRPGTSTHFSCFDLHIYLVPGLGNYYHRLDIHMTTAKAPNLTATFDGTTIIIERGLMHPERGTKRIPLSSVTSVRTHRAVLAPDHFIIETAGGTEDIMTPNRKAGRAQWDAFSESVNRALENRDR